jgi:antitoxin VapB
MYTMYMALHITNSAVERTVRELAGVTGESMTDAIGTAAAERLERLRPSTPSRLKPTAEEIMELVRSYHLQPINEDLTEDEILGYGPDGIPE